MRTIHVPRRFVRSHWGGTETVILQVCRQLQAKGHHASIMTPEALADNRHEVIDGVTVDRFPYFYPWLGLDEQARRRLDQKGGNLFSFALMRALKSAPNIDIIHLHTGKRLGGIVRHVARQRRIPYVVSVHGGVLDMPAAEAATFAEPTRGRIEWGKALGWWTGSRRVYDDAAAILTLGAEEQRLMAARHPGTRVELFPNGVDVDRFANGDGPAFRARHGIPADAPMVLVVGRIDPQKNQLLAVEAMRAVVQRHPRAHLVMVGHVTNDAYETRVRAAMTESGLARQITLIPGLAAASNDLVDAFHAANVFLLPSIHEPFGIVILEAWAAGLAVVASRVGGIPTFVEPGRDALLFESGDVVECAHAVTALLGDAERARAMGESGRTKARRDYSWSSITDRLLTIYEEAIRANPLRQ
jgi:glycosyltransferase involved in cell wall biosynthesis